MTSWTIAGSAGSRVVPREGCLLRIFVGESDRHAGKPLYEWIVLQARSQGLAGATVVRGMMGFGAHSRLHTFKVERLSLDLPVVIEIVDAKEKLEAFLASIDDNVTEGLATLERVDVRIYRSGSQPGAGGGSGAG
jgi:hypothetical protein